MGKKPQEKVRSVKHKQVSTDRCLGLKGIDMTYIVIILLLEGIFFVKWKFE